MLTTTPFQILFCDQSWHNEWTVVETLSRESCLSAVLTVWEEISKDIENECNTWGMMRIRRKSDGYIIGEWQYCCDDVDVVEGELVPLGYAWHQTK
jgi:hypothetical protein